MTHFDGSDLPLPLAPSGLHITVIMEGNGRWARMRGLYRQEGHRAGASAVRRTVQAAVSLEIDWLTLFAFSSDNWQRPAPEVASLLKLFGDYLREETAGWVEKGIRVRV